MLAGCLLVLGCIILYPVLRLAFEALLHWEWAAISEGRGLRATVNTLVISFASVLTSGLFGTALAAAVFAYRFPGRNILAGLAYLPFTLPPLVGTLSFYYLIGRDGLFPRLAAHVMHSDGWLVPGPWAILLIHTYSFYVFFYAMVGPALENLDRSQMEAARTLGAKRGRVLFRVVLPLLMPALLGASLLTFMSSAASFSAPYFFGQDYPMLSVEIYNARSQHEAGTAVTLTVVLAAVSLCGLLLFRGRRHALAGGTKGTPAPVRSVAGKLLAGACAWSVILLLLIPHLNIVWLALIDYRAWNDEIFPTTFTLANFTALFSSPRDFKPMVNSFWMSLLATGLTTLIGLPAAYLIARRRPGGRLLNLVVMIPWALPGTVIAMNLILAFNSAWAPLYNTIWLLPLAYVVRNVPLLTRMAGAAIAPFDATLIEGARTLGASRAYALRRIVFPLLAPAVVGAMALVFATCLGEFVASVLLYTPANVPISVQINMVLRGSVGVAFAYSVLLMLLVAATFLFTRRFMTLR